MKSIQQSRAGWWSLISYHHFESVVAFVLTLIISLVIIVALYRLIIGVIDLLGLAAITLTLGITYWLIREWDERLSPTRALHPPGRTALDLQR